MRIPVVSVDTIRDGIEVGALFTPLPRTVHVGMAAAREARVFKTLLSL